MKIFVEVLEKGITKKMDINESEQAEGSSI
jgi:hypothetical protein